ncbi:MAG: hypothetical protein JRG91_00580 [Deltaproteobacteria bacterium]|nr:hypothetical protein [Deltaproteobacteria bacterium]
MNPHARTLACITLAALLTTPSCKKPEPRQQAGTHAPSQTKKVRPPKTPIYDSEGIRLPQEALPFGTPIPVGLTESATGRTWARYSGPIKPDEIIDFYRKYLTLPEGTAPHEVGSSTRFIDARPKQPGNPGRPVEVRVVSEQRGTRSGVVIFDMSAINKAKETDWEKVPLVDPREWKPSKPGEKVPSDLL